MRVGSSGPGLTGRFTIKENYNRNLVRRDTNDWRSEADVPRFLQRALLMPFEVLDFALVLFCARTGFESAQVPSLPGLGIFFARVQSILA